MAFSASAKVVCLRGELALLMAAWVLVCLGAACAAGVAEASAASSQSASGRRYADDRILVQPKPGTSREALARFHSARQAKVLQTFEGIGGLQVVALPARETVPGFIAKYQESGLIEYPTESYQQIINRVLSATDPLPSLAGKSVTGGQLNLRKAVTPIRLSGMATAPDAPFQLHLSATTNLTCVIQTSTNLTDWSGIFTNTTSAGGTFDFTDNQSTNWPQRFYRAVTSP